MPRCLSRARIIACSLMLACAVARGQTPTDAGTVQAIRSLEREWADAQGRNDNRSLDLLFDNALIYVEYGRLVTKGEYLLRIRQEAPLSDQVVVETMTVHPFGTTAIAVGTYKELQFGNGRRTVLHWRFVDTWVYKKNGWVLVAAASTPISNSK